MSETKNSEWDPVQRQVRVFTWDRAYGRCGRWDLILDQIYNPIADHSIHHLMIRSILTESYKVSIHGLVGPVEFRIS